MSRVAAGGAGPSAEVFRRLAQRSAEIVGSSWAFATAVAVVAVWAVSGPLFRFSDTWQLVINTATTIVTFLMVFLIQNAQNRDARALHLKLDELIRSIEGARNSLIHLEDLSDEQLDGFRRQFDSIREARGRGARVAVPSPPSAGRAP